MRCTVRVIKPSFRTGAAQVFDFYGDLAPKICAKVKLKGYRDDKAALAGDRIRIGSDIRKALLSAPR